MIAFSEIFSIPLRNGLTRPTSVRGSGRKMVNMGEIFAADRIVNLPMDRVPLSDQEEKQYSLEPGDLLFARQSLTLAGAGKCSIFISDTEPITFESHIIRARLDKSRVNPLFYYYYFRSPAGRAVIESIVEQVSAAGIRGSDLARIKVPFPQRHEQDRIADVLSSLDEKIEANRQLSQNLANLASSLFESWFCRFDPTLSAAHDASLDSSEITGVFPTRLVESDLGFIPQGWELGKLASVAKMKRESVLPEDIDAGDAYIALEHMPKNSIVLDRWETNAKLASSKSRFSKGDILFGKLRPYFHKVGIAPRNGVCSTDIIVMNAIDPDYYAFVLGVASSSAFVDWTSSASTGTKMPRTNWNDMARYSIAIPPPEIAKVYCEIMTPIFERIVVASNESRDLAMLRDALLPVLMKSALEEGARDAVSRGIAS